MQTDSLVSLLLTEEVGPAAAEAEESWRKAWLVGVAGKGPPILLSALGGALADRLAWVFHAGYQGAIRHVFPHLVKEHRFIALVTSEDREGRWPPVTLSPSDSTDRTQLVSGTKTWVAAARTAGLFVVSAGWGGAQRFVLVPRDAPGVTVDPGDTPSFLSVLSQGRAHFDHVEVTPDDRLGAATEHTAFGTAEPLHVLTALNAFIFSRARNWENGASFVQQAATHLAASEALATLPLESPDVALALAGLDASSSRLADAFEPVLLANDTEAPGTWIKDRKIISFYRRGTAARAATATGAQ